MRHKLRVQDEFARSYGGFVSKDGAVHALLVIAAQEFSPHEQGVFTFCYQDEFLAGSNEVFWISAIGVGSEGVVPLEDGSGHFIGVAALEPVLTELTPAGAMI
jgi:hypothetical protein